MRKVKWGVLGVAKIAVEKVIPAMQRSEACEIVAVASRDRAKARKAAERLGIERAYGSYGELLADPAIEAVYNPLPNELHVPWTLRAMEAGKPVLCEKPVGLDANEARALIEARERYAVVSEDRVTVGNISPYFSNRVEWTEWFRTIAGVRADFYRFNVDANIPANSGNESQSKVSPKFSAIFGPWANTEYFLNWGQGFHSNDARGTTIRVDPKTGDPVDPVSPLVRTTGYEAGLRSAPLPGLTTSLAVWALKQDSELLFVGDAGTTEASRPSKRTGVEWLVQYVPRPWISMDLSLAFTRARFTEDDPLAGGNYIPGAPNKVASAGVTADSGQGWFGALRWRYFGPRPLDESGREYSRSTSLVNARVGYTFSPKIKVWVDVFNLFNRQNDDISYYYVSRLPGEPADGVADVHFHPVESRAVRLTLSLAY